MIAEKISGATKVLRGLGGHVHEEVWEVIRAVLPELDDAAAQAENLENGLPIAGAGETAQHTPAQA